MFLDMHSYYDAVFAMSVYRKLVCTFSVIDFHRMSVLLMIYSVGEHKFGWPKGPTGTEKKQQSPLLKNKSKISEDPMKR